MTVEALELFALAVLCFVTVGAFLVVAEARYEERVLEPDDDGLPSHVRRLQRPALYDWAEHEDDR